MLHFFTSAALNYLPKVKLLTDSIRKFHPEAHIHLALADVAPVELSLDFFDSVLSPADLGIENWRCWAFGHTIVELSTAIKPFVLERLLCNDHDQVIYLDPDTVLFSRLDDVLSALENYSVALTPHLTSPEVEWSAVLDNEVSSLKHGAYNLGFVAVAASKTGREFAAWWRERCFRLCIDDTANGLFTDQRWIDLVPGLFPGVVILRTPRLNISTWNISSRPIVIKGDQLFVNEEPLGFYHFTGFDSGAHRIAASHYAKNSPDVFKLIDWYAEAIKLSADDPLSKCAWSFAAYDNGEPITKLQRRVYRSRLDLQRAFPHPFDSKGYLTWWKRTGEAEYNPVANEEIKAELGRGLIDASISKKTVWRVLSNILHNPRLIIAYYIYVRQLVAKGGLAALLRTFRSRL